MNGVASETGKPQSAWSYVVLIGVAKAEVDEALKAGDTIDETFTDPDGIAHVGALPTAILPQNISIPTRIAQAKMCLQCSLGPIPLLSSSVLGRVTITL